MNDVRLHVFFYGRVQGVGFRYTAFRIAGKFPVTGWVRNLDDGLVELVAEGARADLDRFLAAVEEAFAGFIKKKEAAWTAASDEFNHFEIAG